MNDLRHAFRSLTRSPGFTAVVLFTLALGIGVNTSMYSLMDALLFRSAPFPEADRLTIVQGTSARSQRGGFSFVELEEMRAQAASDPSHPFESLTTLSGWNNTLAEPGQPAERLSSIDATADFFTTFRVQPILGRAYTADEQVPGRNQVALLSHALWQSRFAGDPTVVGRSIRLNAEQVTIIGVMPPNFAYPLLWGKVDLWRPITIARHIVENRHNRFFSAIGRLKAGATLLEAKARLEPLAAGWAKDYPNHDVGRGFAPMELHKSTIDSVGNVIVWLLFGLGGSVLLIACANIANLQLARATANARDLAIRSALGASRFRLIRHQLTESMVLALAGGVGGVMVAWGVNRLLGNAIRIGDAGGLSLPIDFRVLGVALLASLLTGVLFGLLPAWLASRVTVVNALKQQTRSSTSGKGASRTRHALIVAEVALALALLGVATVMIRGFGAMLKKNHGWDTERVLVGNIHLPEQSTYNSEDKRRAVIEKLERRLGEISGAEQTAIASTVPTFGYSKTMPIQVDGQTSDRQEQQPTAGFTMVSANYFATLGIALKEGTVFSPDLRGESPPVIVINETLARRFWPNESAIGKRIADRQGDKLVSREVIGVVRDIQFALNLANPPTMFQIYKPLVHEPWGYLHLVVRGPGPASFKNALRRAVTDVDPDVAVQELYTIPESVDRFQHNIVVVNQTLGGFALLGLVLAAVGLYGVISNLVAQRTGEFGIRLALGAKPWDVVALVLRTGLRLTAVGLMVGAGLAYALNRMLASTMPRMAAIDPLALTGVALVLLAVALLACWVPARRATQVNLLEALRAE
ncbi:MAG: ABC transporter permease [Opitutaceae bacterium]